MSLSKMEAQRLLERVSKLESQVSSLKFKLENMEKMLRPEDLLRRVREGESEEKRKAASHELDLMAASELMGRKPNPT